MNQLLILFFLTFFLSIILTSLIRKLAIKWKIIDYPNSALTRKIHHRPTPLLGGLSICLSFFIVFVIFYFLRQDYFIAILSNKQLLGILIASFVLMIGGCLDDKYQLLPQQQIVFPFLAVIIVIIAGISIQYINNPITGGLFDLEQFKIKLFTWQNIPYYFVFFANIFTFFWLMGMMYTTKLLDGLDGLVSSLVVVGSLIIALFCLTQRMNLPLVADLGIILAGAFTGFLLFNWHPAKVFLGEGGSLWAGFMLGILAMLGGGKVAITSLIIGLPALDVLLVIIKRFIKQKKNPFLADQNHFHHRLLLAGLSVQQTVLFYCCLATIFGGLALFLQTAGKIIALFCLIILIFIFSFLLKHKRNNKILIN